MNDENIACQKSTRRSLLLSQMETQFLQNAARVLRKKAADTEEDVRKLNELADAMERVVNERIEEPPK